MTEVLPFSDQRVAAANRHLLTAVQRMRDWAEEDLQLALDALLQIAEERPDVRPVALAGAVVRQLARRKEPGGRQ